MPKPAWRKGFLVALALVSVQSYASSAPLNQTLPDEIMQAGVADNRYKTLLDRVANSLLKQSDQKSQASVNQPYNSSGLNLYIIDVDSYLAARPAPSLSGILVKAIKALRDNALALPPDVIIFDSHLIETTAANTHVGQLLFSRMETDLDDPNLLQRQLPLSTPDEVLGQTYSAIGELHRLRRIRDARTLQGRERDRAEGLLVVERMLQSPQILESNELAFAPVLFHEIGHLAAGESGNFLDSLSSAVNAVIYRRVAAAENAADSFSMDLIRKVIEHRKSARKGDAVFYYQAALRSIDWIRDRSIVDAFADFRGIQPEDRFIITQHFDCREAGYEDLAGMDFSDPRAILAASQSYYPPPLRRDEFDGIRSGVLQDVRFGTHQHSFRRAAEYLRAILNAPKQQSLDHAGFEEQLLEAAINNDPLAFSPRHSGTSIGLAMDQLVAGVNNNVEFQEAVNCLPHECFVGFFRDGRPGFIEAMARKGEITSVEFALPLFGPGTSGRLDDVDPDYAKATATFVTLIDNVFRGVPRVLVDRDIVDGNVGRLLLDNATDEVTKCGIVSGGAYAPRSWAGLRSMNENGWVSVQVRALDLCENAHRYLPSNPLTDQLCR
jgi:hypothetical protein